MENFIFCAVSGVCAVSFFEQIITKWLRMKDFLHLKDNSVIIFFYTVRLSPLLNLTHE